MQPSPSPNPKPKAEAAANLNAIDVVTPAYPLYSFGEYSFI